MCVGDDLAIGHPFAVEFGECFSCTYGNPLFTDMQKATIKEAQAKAKVKAEAKAMETSSSDLMYYPPPPDYYTTAYPSSFIQHAVAVLNEYTVGYCLAAGSFL